MAEITVQKPRGRDLGRRWRYAEGLAAVEEVEPEGGGGHRGFSCDDRGLALPPVLFRAQRAARLQPIALTEGRTGMAVQAGGGQDIMAKTMVPRCAHARRRASSELAHALSGRRTVAF